MDRRAEKLIHGYLDDLLDADEQVALARWIESDPEHARQFALAVLQHDRLRDHFRVVAADE